MRKSVLIVSFHFAPQNVIGAVRPTKLAKYLNRMGYEVTVLCGKGYSAARDPILARDLAELADVHVVREHSLFRWWKERGLTPETPRALNSRAVLPEQAMTDTAMRASADAAYRQNAALQAQKSPAAKPGQTHAKGPAQPAAQSLSGRLLNALYVWLAGQADAAFARACVREIYAMGKRFDVVLSSYGPLSAHTVARRLKQQKLADRWIADFRDEASVPFPWQKQRLARYLRNVRKNADVIMAVSLGFLQMMKLDAFGRVTPNGFDREDLRGLTPLPPDEDALAFAYCGQLHEGHSDLTPVFQAMRELVDAGEWDARRIRIHYAGKQGDVLARQAARFGLGNTVVDHGMLSRADSLTLQQSVDALLAATWNTSARKGVVTGKLLEYLMANKPIVCCVSGELAGSEAAALLAKTQAGIACEQANAAVDAPKLKAYLHALYTARLSAATPVYLPDARAVAAFDYANIASDVAQILESV